MFELLLKGKAYSSELPEGGAATMQMAYLFQFQQYQTPLHNQISNVSILQLWEPPGVIRSTRLQQELSELICQSQLLILPIAHGC